MHHKITKYETKLWINHAISRFYSLGKNQKELAKELGIEESRLSDMKSGKGVINSNLETKIINLCGAPKRGKGRYEEVEEYISVEDFLESYQSDSSKRFKHKLYEEITSEKYIGLLLKNIDLEAEVKFEEDENSRQKLIITLVNKLIRSDKFRDICTNYTLALKTPDSSNFKWQNTTPSTNKELFLKMENLVIKDKDIFHALYLQSCLAEEYSEYKLGLKNEHYQQELFQIKPVVITGECILTLSKTQLSKESPINRHSYTEIIPMVENHKLFFGNSDSNNYFSKPEIWGEVACQLYLGEEMNYHLLIHLSKSDIKYEEPIPEHENNPSEWDAIVGKQDRVIVIPNIAPLTLFDNIEKLNKWCELPSDSHYKLKTNIAKNGGHVSGAKFLV